MRPEHQLLLDLRQLKCILRAPTRLVHLAQELLDIVDALLQIRLVRVVIWRVLEHCTQ
jgi:hypothetical protein